MPHMSQPVIGGPSGAHLCVFQAIPENMIFGELEFEFLTSE